MSTWRVGRRNPHTVYRQHGDQPRGYEHDDHDDSLGYFRFPEDAERAVEAVNDSALLDRIPTRSGRADTCLFVAVVLGQLRSGLRVDGYDGAAELVDERRAHYARLGLAMTNPDGTLVDGGDEPTATPVILASHADHPLTGQIQAVLDEEGVDGLADAIRRVAREVAR